MKKRTYIILLFAFTLISANLDNGRKYWDFNKDLPPAFEFYGDTWETNKVGQGIVSKEMMEWGYELTLETDTSKYIHPSFGDITSKYGMRWGKLHKGIDIHVAHDEPIYAAFDGVVRLRTYQSEGYGNVLVIRHFNGLETLYAHLSELPDLKQNEIVKGGQLIALGGNTGTSTGTHLHFETRFLGYAIDPAKFIDFETYKLRESVVKVDETWIDW